MRLARRGFTLMEVLVVMIILAILTALAAPAFGGVGLFKQQTTTSIFITLLHDARQFAIEHSATVTLVIDPKNGHYRGDTSGIGGTGPVEEDSLYLGSSDALETSLPRLRYVFFPSGASFGDSVTIRGTDSTRAIFVDTWSGLAYTRPR